jgi:predicted GH43/DUF377 family glycosyl hydrolase
MSPSSGPALGSAPFIRQPGAILGPDPSLTFHCPVAGAEVAWAAKDVFNPGAVVRDGRVHLLVRAEDEVGRYAGTSRLGLATSDDGVHFTLEPEPVLFPDDDPWQAWEWPGGCEDPRVVESPDGGYVCLYTGFAGRTPTLLVATSDDLRSWTKHGPAFAGTPHALRSSKSASVVTELVDGRLVAARIDGRFLCYWGEGIAYGATSDDLVHWTPVDFDATGDRSLRHDAGRWRVDRVPGTRVLRPVLFPRPGRFDSLLVEPGPPAVLDRTDGSVTLLVNGANHPRRGDPSLPPGSYQPGVVRFDALDPWSVVERSTVPFLRPETADEVTGQVDGVCFAQGLVRFDGRWFLYVGMADSRIGCATAP